MSLDERFQKAAKDATVLKEQPKDSIILELYGLYKQANVGDINIEKPGMFDFKGKSKWEAWNGKKGMSKDEAKEAYIKLVEELIQTIGLA